MPRRNPVKGQIIKTITIALLGTLVFITGATTGSDSAMATGALILLVSPYLAAYLELRELRREEART